MSFITGLGAISAIGSGTDTLGQDRAVPTPRGAFLQPEIAETPFFQGNLPEEVSRAAFELALSACRQALADADVDPRRDNIALVLATGAGDTLATECNGEPKVRPYDLALRLALRLGLRGVFLTVSTGCSASSYGVAIARDLINSGCDHVLLCGVEAKSDASQYTFKSLMVLDADGCFPFAEDRKGTVLGAGAAALLFSERPRATRQPYARLSAVSLTCDGFHDTAPDPEGRALRASMEAALAEAAHTSHDIEVFVPHATGTRLNDDIEQTLLSALFGERASPERMILLKGDIGHTCGASSAFSMVAGACMLRDKRAKAVLIGATSFGGNNASVILCNVGTPKATA